MVLVISACSNSNQRKQRANPLTQTELIERFQGIIDSAFRAVPEAKGMAMHVEAPTQEISISLATGWADEASKRKLKPNDPALIASITKTYLSATFLRLVEMDKLSITEPISTHLPDTLIEMLKTAGYATDMINVAHLNSQTSGIADYVNTADYMGRSEYEPEYVWTRDEQLKLAMTNPVIASPGDTFAYSETNNLLLGIIVEEITGKPFYTAMRDLLAYDKNGLHHTWFPTLEEAPKDLAPLVHQFATKYKVESFSLHPSFDLYGGGGIATTTKDVARFTQLFFSGELFNNPKTAELLYFQPVKIPENEYYMAHAKRQLGEFECYGHGGFWGTTTQYFPSLNASISIFLMERDAWPHYLGILEEVAKVISSNE
ncbi:MAG: beta-lactamase family protein [Bacteroidetes bacterium]|nr:beta-lactamase family protein [Bacteroidota bacterium]